MPAVEKDAAALNLANGYLYAATSGYIGDAGPYDGHVVVLRLRDGLTHVFNSLCSTIHHLLLAKSYDPRSAYSCTQVRSGIWSRAGVVVDPDPAMHGRIYVATGNGLFTANAGGHDYGDSVLALSADGSRLLDYFTPADYSDLDEKDMDLGSSAPVLLPRVPHSRTPLLAVQGGKDGIVRLLDRARLGGVHGELQDLAVPGAVLFSAPAVWRGPHGGIWVYLGDADHVTALRLTTGARGVSRLSIAWNAPVGGTSPIVVNGVVFAATGGALTALDARTGTMLWSSTRPSAGGTIGDIHWESPIALDGWLYCSDQSGHLTAYALTK
jgi:outer membrane protein assembly factor BamB